MKTKKHGTAALLLILFLSFTGCSNDLEDVDGAMLIEQYDLAGRYKVQITPKMMGLAAITSGEHDAELINEGDGVLRLKFSGFQREPMPFEMSVDVKMRVKPGPNSELILENIGGDFDADLPEGTSVINPDDIPGGIEVPEDALANGIHSNGKSSISGVYKMLTNIDGTEAINFEWNLEPNVGLPVVVNIRTNSKIE
ncbi:MAG: hypothetical protein ACK5MZ_09705 [Aestuariibaculum sp.]